MSSDAAAVRKFGSGSTPLTRRALQPAAKHASPSVSTDRHTPANHPFPSRTPTREHVQQAELQLGSSARRKRAMPLSGKSWTKGECRSHQLPPAIDLRERATGPERRPRARQNRPQIHPGTRTCLGNPIRRTRKGTKGSNPFLSAAAAARLSVLRGDPTSLAPLLVAC